MTAEIPAPNQATADPTIAGILTQVQVPDESHQLELKDVLVELLQASAKSLGFWSGEITPPGRLPNWSLLARFNSMREAEAWKNSEARTTLLKKLQNDLPGCEIREEIVERGVAGKVSTAIVTTVSPEMQESYWKWVAKMQRAQVRHPGWAGIYFEPPSPERDEQWTAIVRFDSPAHLETWFESPVRQKLLEEARELIREHRIQRLSTPFPGWVPIDPDNPNQTPRWKSAIMVLIGLYPVLSLIRVFVLPHLSFMPRELASATGCMMSISAVSWLTMPFLVKTFGWWLLPKDPGNQSDNLKGLAICATIFAVEVFGLPLLLPNQH